VYVYVYDSQKRVTHTHMRSALHTCHLNRGEDREAVVGGNPMLHP